MKYIRTKDGRIITPIQYDDVFDSTECKDEDILRLGKLEELCDEFVIIGEHNSYIVEINKLDKDCESWTKEVGIPTGKVKCYGAIWTDKGLIYVAKMNDKGELELL